MPPTVFKRDVLMPGFGRHCQVGQKTKYLVTHKRWTEVLRPQWQRRKVLTLCFKAEVGRFLSNFRTILEGSGHCWNCSFGHLQNSFAAHSAFSAATNLYVINTASDTLWWFCCRLWTCGRLQIAALKSTPAQHHSVPVHYGCICSKPPESKLSIIRCSRGQGRH